MGVEFLANNLENKDRLKRNITLVSGSGNKPLAEKIAEITGVPVDFPISRFSDGEVIAQLASSQRTKETFILQSFTPGNINNQLVELLLMIDAAKRASSAEITVVLPYFPYARADRKDRPRVSIAASLLSRLIQTSGANRIATISIHAEQTMGSFDGPWDNVYASFSLIPKINKVCEENDITNLKDELIIVSPDTGGTKRAEFYARTLECPFGVLPKVRDTQTGQTQHYDLISGSSVAGRMAIIVDDMCAGGSTGCKGAEILTNQGAVQTYLVAEHGLFVGNALANITNSPLTGVITTDTICQPSEVLNHPKIGPYIVSVAPLLADLMRLIHTGESIGDKLILA